MAKIKGTNVDVDSLKVKKDPKTGKTKDCIIKNMK